MLYQRFGQGVSNLSTAAELRTFDGNYLFKYFMDTNISVFHFAKISQRKLKFGRNKLSVLENIAITQLIFNPGKTELTVCRYLINDLYHRRIKLKKLKCSALPFDSFLIFICYDKKQFLNKSLAVTIF